jgi:hypothetical protein
MHGGTFSRRAVAGGKPFCLSAGTRRCVARRQGQDAGGIRRATNPGAALKGLPGARIDKL